MLFPRLLAALVVAASGWVGAPAAAQEVPTEHVGADPSTTGPGLQHQLARAAGAPSQQEVDTPLAVSLSELSPSVIPDRGPVRVSGTVTNLDEVSWRLVNVYAFVSAAPMTTSAELSEAAATDPAAPVGERITVETARDTIEEIQPGDSAPFSFSVPARLLEATDQGVYWFGVHALGENENGRDLVADGRARTFLPRVVRRAEPVETALVVPLRHRIAHEPDGSLADVEEWAQALSPRGRLRSLLDLGASAADRRISWLVDPALLDAVRQLANGNPPRSLAPTIERPDDGQDGQEDSGSPSATSTGSPQPEEDGEQQQDQRTSGGAEPDPTVQAASDAASSWLQRLRSTMENGDEVLTLPYGDVDAAGASRNAPTWLEQAREHPVGELGSWDVSRSTVLAPPDGYLPPAAVRAAPAGTSLLVTDRMLPSGAAVATLAGRRLVATSSAAVAGGPGPEDPRTTIAMRQRILSEAAVRRAGSPLVVMLPQDWDPESATGFFVGLDLPWLDLTSVADARNETAVQVRAADLTYPEEQETPELGPAAFTAAGRLAAVGGLLQNVLTLNDRVGSVVAGEALAATSYSARWARGQQLRSTREARVFLEGQLRGVEVTAPPGVTLASSSGRFGTTLINRLDQPVTVRLDVISDRPLRVTLPRDIEIAARGRATVLLDAHTTESGIHNVQLRVTDVEGNPLGSSDDLSLRPSRVSGVIWVFMAAGGLVLFGAIALRIVRRLRERNRPTLTAVQPLDPTDPAEPVETA